LEKKLRIPVWRIRRHRLFVAFGDGFQDGAIEAFVEAVDGPVHRFERVARVAIDGATGQRQAGRQEEAVLASMLMSETSWNIIFIDWAAYYLSCHVAARVGGKLCADIPNPTFDARLTLEQCHGDNPCIY
jgi:hypothetical protein